MAIFKCKMCGGALEINNNETVATCEYCGTQQTLPKLDDDKRANMYDRANHFRRNNEFDKAMGIYEQILNEDNTDAEAYWSLVLCRYGIEYVEDPSSHKRIPTVNRAQFTSIFDDDNYKSALLYADGYQRNIYEEEAKAINEIQKGILAISSQEEPFDVFICYKETDNNGRRTPDSVLANDLYHQLTQEGFKVFFARITLEDKLGSAYEPYIFAALNSAKVMVVLGTKPEFFNAVWVKNEWSRYLSLIKNGAKKMLIPAYKDMDPYDLPEEFSHLQAQDMSKLGFMQDLIRGIKKIAELDAPKTTVVKETVVTGVTNANIAPLLKRAFMFLEDGDWTRADEFCEQVLNIDPECAEAYLGKLMSQLNVKNKENLKHHPVPFDKNSNYQKAVRFADEKLKNELQGYINFITARNIETAYNNAVNIMESAKTVEEYKKAVNIFSGIGDYKDSKAKITYCETKIQELLTAQEEYQKEQMRIAEEKRQAKEQMAIRKKKKVFSIISLLLAIVFVSVFVFTSFNFNPWKDIAAISAGGTHTVGLKKDGTVVAVGYNDYGQCDVSDWKNIVAIAGYWHTVGLKKDGTVVAVGDNSYGKCDVSDWKDMVAISAGEHHTVGLKKDGTVVAVGDNGYGQCDVADWKDIVAISAGAYHTVGLKKDGAVVAVGYNYGQCNVSDWKNIVAISAGAYHTVGLKKDGTVVATGENGDGQCDLSDWKNIVAISAGYWHTVGLKKDGTVVATGANSYGQCDVSDWKNIVAISVGIGYTVGLKKDGTVVAVGDNVNGQCNFGSWKGFFYDIIE